MVVYVLVEEWSSNSPSSGNHIDYDISTTTTPTSTTVTATSASLLPSATTAITTHHRCIQSSSSGTTTALSSTWIYYLKKQQQNLKPVAYFIFRGYLSQETTMIKLKWLISMADSFILGFNSSKHTCCRKLLASGGAWQCNRSCGNIDMTLERYDLEFGSDELQAMCVLQAHRIFKLDTSWASYSEYMKFFTNEHCLNAANE
ncbi:hypothetical protein L2E82_45987 [Cichorium intybus]|uniref:Uncharacterized protein n=1 Tax=Cichorium intybus TaxID=13427 RepID=A0ACB8ZV12_CICIN|nr:hypothetical protein L2E82_45987 [Cichorium intybus]